MDMNEWFYRSYLMQRNLDAVSRRETEVDIMVKDSPLPGSKKGWFSKLIRKWKGEANDETKAAEADVHASGSANEHCTSRSEGARGGDSCARCVRPALEAQIGEPTCGHSHREGA